MPVETRIVFRKDTAANWTSVNPILLAGEWGYETGTNTYKIGNGSAAWTALPYASGPAGPTGAAGPTGPTGPTGPAGVAALYLHTQVTPAATWTINHSRGAIPAATTVLTVGGVEMDAEIVHTTVNQTQVLFVVATAGTARLL